MGEHVGQPSSELHESRFAEGTACGEGRDYYYDKREKGLVMSVTGTGTKTFYLYKRIEGRPERLMLGRFPDMTVEQARKRAVAAKGEIATGANRQIVRYRLADVDALEIARLQDIAANDK